MGFASPYVTGQRQCDVNVLLSDGEEKEDAFFKVVFGVRSISLLHNTKKHDHNNTQTCLSFDFRAHMLRLISPIGKYRFSQHVSRTPN
jgi:hypothetical protein